MDGGRDPAAASLSPAAGRLVGLAVLCLAGLLWFGLIPAQIEFYDQGFMRPQTLPLICAGGIGICGALLVLFPGGQMGRSDPREVLRGAGVLALCSLAVWAMGYWGFLIVAPVLALILALGLGERRLFWLAIATLALPLAIWLVVEPLLGRALP
ncbi:tripartite tricarboxylate transporter TctB family protein [Chachezhania sediminis]|uniref:tripartite tricarboxylate transporter TctB family protein n=1 Tax=Chachezhania sediminis TaxID=2599291 RepID=UPI001E553192|nr:tripartite tricarboxylate transporter TctB family protein [Chachezhania sediminis]